MAKNDARPASPYRYAEGTVTLLLHVQPGAARSEWAGRYGEGALKLRLAAPALDNKANLTCVRFLSEQFSVPPSNIAIVRGKSSRGKTVEIRSVPVERWQLFRDNWERT